MVDKKELIRILKRDTGDKEVDHGNADDALLDFINDKEITEAFNSVDKWYA